MKEKLVQCSTSVRIAGKDATEHFSFIFLKTKGEVSHGNKRYNSNRKKPQWNNY